MEAAGFCCFIDNIIFRVVFFIFFWPFFFFSVFFGLFNKTLGKKKEDLGDEGGMDDCAALFDGN